jgi:hypothetical protein
MSEYEKPRHNLRKMIGIAAFGLLVGGTALSISKCETRTEMRRSEVVATYAHQRTLAFRRCLETCRENEGARFRKETAGRKGIEEQQKPATTLLDNILDILVTGATGLVAAGLYNSCKRP